VSKLFALARLILHYAPDAEEVVCDLHGPDLQLSIRLALLFVERVQLKQENMCAYNKCAYDVNGKGWR
jgi:hypothetical protein